MVTTSAEEEIKKLPLVLSFSEISQRRSDPEYTLGEV